MKKRINEQGLKEIISEAIRNHLNENPEDLKNYLKYGQSAKAPEGLKNSNGGMKDDYADYGNPEHMEGFSSDDEKWADVFQAQQTIDDYRYIQPFKKNPAAEIIKQKANGGKPFPEDNGDNEGYDEYQAGKEPKFDEEEYGVDFDGDEMVDDNEDELYEAQFKTIAKIVAESARKVLKEISSNFINQKIDNFRAAKDADPDRAKDKWGNTGRVRPNGRFDADADRIRNARNAASNVRYQERLENDPYLKKALELYQDCDLEYEVDDVDGGFASLNLYGEVEDENGETWRFYGSGGACWEGDWSNYEVEDMSFEAPDGHSGSL